MELSKSDLGIIAEKLTNKVIDRAIDNPLEAIRTADSILSIAVNVLPTLPWETPLPIPRGVYAKLKEAEGRVPHIRGDEP